MLIPPGPIICPNWLNPWSQSSTVTTLVLDLDHRNKWFPKAFGLWRVQGGARTCLLALVTNEGGVYSVTNQIPPGTVAPSTAATAA
jgi:hypothetical protein